MSCLNFLNSASGQPPLISGRLRVYSMEYCPYAQRVRLVLLAKHIPHDVVNINLGAKPDWYFNIHPQGKVPALDTGSEIVLESLDICDFLDRRYPNPPLYPSDTASRQKDEDLIQEFGELFNPLIQVIYNPEEKNEIKINEQLLPAAQVLEDELANRGTQYFGGQTPGMVDYILWPWAERSGVLRLRLGRNVVFDNEKLLLLKRWTDLMRKQPAVNAIFNEPEKYEKVLEARQKGSSIDIDNL